MRQVLDLQPGVIETGDLRGVSLRGSPPGDAATYIDGALIRNGQRGEQDLLLGTNAIQGASLITGPLTPEAGNAGSGLVAYSTKAGGDRWRGTLHYRTDDVGINAWGSVGLHRVEVTLGGPLLRGLTFSSAVTLNGQQSVDGAKDRDSQAPVYVADGIDTLVHQPATWHGSPTDTAVVTIPRFVQYSGSCDASRNYGATCQGLRVPLTANGSYAWQGKVQWSGGAGSLLSLTGLASQVQQRDFPGVDLYNPANQTATGARSFATILNWAETLWRSVIVSANLSNQVDRRISGPLTGSSELDSRDPFGGFLLAPLGHATDFNSSHTVHIGSVTYAGVGYLDDRQIQCLQAGEGWCLDNVPHLDDNALSSVMPYRMNPYGIEQGSLFPLWTSGQDNGVDLSRESRWEGRGSVGWRTSRSNTLIVGFDYQHFDTERYSDPNGANSSFELNAYRENPIAHGAYLEDRLERGRGLIVAGVRYDAFDSRASFPFTPGRISSLPRLPSDTVCDAAGKNCGIVPNGTLAFDPANPTAHFVRASSHAAWSPRIQGSYAIAKGSIIRASYARQVQAPPFDVLFAAKNTDLTLATRSLAFGRDLDLSKTEILELGFQQAFGDDWLFDVAVYNKRLSSAIGERIVELPDPEQGPAPGAPHAYETANFVVFENVDLGSIHGVDGMLTRRFSHLLAVTAAYGHDSPSYPDDAPRTAIAGTVAATTPSSAWLLRNTSAFATFRLTSGEAYTRVTPVEAGFTLANSCGLICSPVEPTLSSHLPWFKTVDIRIQRGFKARGAAGSLFLESTNLFNFTNIKNLFTEVGAVVYPGYESRYVSEQKSRLSAEARSAGILMPDSSVAFTALGGCGNWQGLNSGGYASGPVDCVLLERAEQRFGNGDGIFTPAEYTAAFTAWYNLANAPSYFYGPGRRIRVGVQLSF